MRLTKTLCLILTLIPSTAFADTWLTRTLGTFGSDAAYIAAAPTRLDTRSAVRLGWLATLGAGLAYSLDGEFGLAAPGERDDARRDVPDVLTGPGVFFDRIGTKWVAAYGAGLLVASGVVTGNDRLVGTAGRLVEAVVLTKAVTGLSKRLIGRTRPFVENGPRSFEPLNLGNPRHKRSMPSGHTSSAFALATVFAERHDHPAVQIGAYAVATSVALQRVESRSHWISDTLIGGVLGHSIAKAILRRDEDGSGGLTVSPSVGIGRVSGVVQYAF